MPITTAMPPKNLRCTEALSDTLKGYRGIEQVEFDIDQGSLKATYDQRILSGENAMRIVRQAGEVAALRVAQCAAKKENGHSACAACTGAMGVELSAQYKAVAALPSTHFENGLIKANLNQRSLAINEKMEHVEAAFLGDETAITSTDETLHKKTEILFTAITLLSGLSAFFGQKLGLAPEFAIALYAVAYVAGSWFGVRESLEALKNKHINVDLLMILAAVGAAIVGQPAEGVILLFLFSLSNTLQSYAMEKSRKAIKKLLQLRPAIATVRRGSRLISLPVEQLTLGDMVIVRPGERFPIDGLIFSGVTDVDQSTITGESMPIHRITGDPVFAGTVNGTGSLDVKVTRLAKDTTLARIVKMVEEAQSSKANTQSMLDTFEEKYAIFVLGAAALLIALPPLFFGEIFATSFYRAMTWLVVASPCALVISTPASILSAIAAAARNGVLFKGGAHLEKSATLKVLAFDKTGTLTNGTPALTSLHTFNGVDEETVLRLAASVESRSEHPLASAIINAARQRQISLPAASDFRAIPGQGVEGRVSEISIWIGNERLFEERGISIPPEILSQSRALEESGQTAMFVYRIELPNETGQFIGLLGMADTLRENAIGMIRQLKANGIERVVMLTGDNPRVAEKIAKLAGVDEFYAGLLPQDKVTVLQTLRRKYGPVAMVGDGVNDAPSLATADIGIAMGSAGTDVAIETADVVLMSDDLLKIPFVIGISRRARQVVYQNLTFSLAVIVVLIGTAFGADLPLTLGVIGHEGSTVIVVLNGLRLLGFTN